MIKEFDNFSLGKIISESVTGVTAHHIIYDPLEGKIMGITESLFRQFGLK